MMIEFEFVPSLASSRKFQSVISHSEQLVLSLLRIADGGRKANLLFHWVDPLLHCLQHLFLWTMSTQSHPDMRLEEQQHDVDCGISSKTHKRDYNRARYWQARPAADGFGCWYRRAQF
jgi:hypothetical protein